MGFTPAASEDDGFTTRDAESGECEATNANAVEAPAYDTAWKRLDI